MQLEDRGAIFEVLDRARSAADARERWRYWKYLDEQVEEAAGRYIPSKSQSANVAEPLLPRPVEDPSSE